MKQHIFKINDKVITRKGVKGIIKKIEYNYCVLQTSNGDYSCSLSVCTHNQRKVGN